MFLNFAACRGLEPALFKLFAALAYRADAAGECDELQAGIAADIRMSVSTVCRGAAELERRGYLIRTRITDGHYRYTIDPRFLTDGSPGAPSPPPEGGDSPERPRRLWRARRQARTCTDANTCIGTSANARAHVSAPVKFLLSSGSKEPSERELSLEQDEIPEGWEEAAAAERRLAGLGAVNLQREWRALLAHAEGARITIWRWRGWVLKARGERSGAPETGSESIVAADTSLPGDERQQRQARDWVSRGFWLRDGSWGPAPDQVGCTLPAELVAWCRRERQARAA